VLNKLDYDFMKYTGRPGPITGRQIERGADGKYHFTGHPNWGINQPGSPGFTGKVYILINGGSYSTTSEFLSQAHFHKRAVFIGEESAGGYYGNSSGMVPRVTLPNTKLALFVPLVTYHMAVSGYKHPARGIIPDQQVEYSISELLLGTDKELALALKLARAGK
jgi:C-terminal processing protease CtpA/Prc